MAKPFTDSVVHKAWQAGDGAGLAERARGTLEDAAPASEHWNVVVAGKGLGFALKAGAGEPQRPSGETSRTLSVG